jgi:amino acid permease
LGPSDLGYRLLLAPGIAVYIIRRKALTGIHLQHTLMIKQLLAIMSTTSSITGVLVWASQCLAYIRYHHWFHDHKKRGILPAEYNRWNPQPDVYPWHKSRTLLASLQPVLAWIGLIACVLVVFVFSSANWWKASNRTFTKVATAYAGVSVLYLLGSSDTDLLPAGDTFSYILRFENTQQERMGETRHIQHSTQRRHQQL